MATNTSACISCKYGMYLSVNNNSCVACPQNCMFCINAEVCLLCQYGFVDSQVGTIYKDYPIGPQNCIACSSACNSC